MNGLFGRYILRNTIHYRKKYVTVFFLTSVLAFVMALAGFFYSGTFEASLGYARLKGDAQLEVYYDAEDSDHPEMSGEQKGKLYRELKAAFLSAGPAELIELSVLDGKIITGSYSGALSLIESKSATRAYGIEIMDDAAPGPGELSLPISMANKLAEGDQITFVFKNSEKIFDSATFTVSGFFVRSGGAYLEALVHEDSLKELDPDLLPRRFMIYDVPRETRLPPMTPAQKAERWASLLPIGLEYFTDEPFFKASTEFITAYDEYSSARGVADFVLAMLLLFILCIGVVAVISIVNVLFVTIVDRVKIIGTMFSFGMGHWKGILLFAMEILVYTGSATALGILFAALASGWVGGIEITIDNDELLALTGGASVLPVKLSATAVGMTVLSGIVIPFLVSVMSIRKILKGDVVRLLQHVR